MAEARLCGRLSNYKDVDKEISWGEAVEWFVRMVQKETWNLATVGVLAEGPHTAGGNRSEWNPLPSQGLANKGTNHHRRKQQETSQPVCSSWHLNYPIK